MTSCSIDDEQNFYLEVIPIDSVITPEEFVLGEPHVISITYTRPNFCYEFNDFYYEIDGNERTVAVVNTVYTNVSCIQNTEAVTVDLNFTPTSNETYIFKFYKGEDDMGQDEYFLVEIPVVNE